MKRGPKNKNEICNDANKITTNDEEGFIDCDDVGADENEDAENAKTNGCK